MHLLLLSLKQLFTYSHYHFPQLRIFFFHRWSNFMDLSKNRMNSLISKQYQYWYHIKHSLSFLFLHVYISAIIVISIVVFKANWSTFYSQMKALFLYFKKKETFNKSDDFIWNRLTFLSCVNEGNFSQLY